jgi:Fic family protein
MPMPISVELALEAIIDEALYSSMIEGARTTKKRAEEMVRRHVSPRDRSEQMTYNNYLALEFILKNLGREVSKEFVNELHAILVKDTLEPEDEKYSGIYRPDQRYVQDPSRGETVYIPPPPDQVEALMQKLYSWINFDSADFLYLHPVVKASIIHFYTVYIHPYVDGNGRVARALMYHHLLRKGYSFFRYFSISKAIKAKRKPYYDAIKNVEDDGTDLTYFILYLVHMVRDAIDTVERELGREQVIKKYLDSQAELNDRQKRFIKMHLKRGGVPMTIGKYQKAFDVVYETARKDLMDLEKRGLVEKTMKGKQHLFTLKGPSER